MWPVCHIFRTFKKICMFNNFNWFRIIKKTILKNPDLVLKAHLKHHWESLKHAPAGTAKEPFTKLTKQLLTPNKNYRDYPPGKSTWFFMFAKKEKEGRPMHEMFNRSMLSFLKERIPWKYGLYILMKDTFYWRRILLDRFSFSRTLSLSLVLFFCSSIKLTLCKSQLVI